MPRITFFLRPNRDKKQTHTLYCRVTHRGTKSEFSLNERLKKSQWNQEAQRLKRNSAQAKFIELLTEKTAYKIKTFAITGEFHTAKELVFAMQNKRKYIGILEAIENYIEEQTTTEATKRNHRAKLQNFELFQDYVGYSLHSENFTIQVAERFTDWYLKTKDTTNICTASRNVSLLKCALNREVVKGTIQGHKLENYKGKKDPKKPVVFLTSSEVENLEKQTFQNDYLNRVKDLFLFQVYTGLSYGDIWNSWKIVERNGMNFINGKRMKNGNEFIVPLSKKCQVLLEKYNYKLPKYQNEPYNRVLKEIVAFCGINKKVSTHTARKTFATLQDGNGWSRESISRMLAHKSIKTTESYYMGANIERVINESMKKENRTY